ncbi:NUDIX hydrolase [Asticcacaulis excentricus]|uniref:Nudix domain protein n=1 Tax=Asticcacaulis excentricus TaxID=78587 RepID=A0A3G9G3L4_9CAUL|nr:NUDIX hydrolase [Asticcacaulis excentricus]BBF79544.1 nudix domain protein [Asticcacaulis excentricus]
MDDHAPPSPATQFGALPFRETRNGEVEFLLITSRGSGQWIIPKGKPIPDLTPAETAAREAFEEAGILGEVDPHPIGRFAYMKDQGQPNAQFIPAVEVFAMRVTQQLTLWPEMGQRSMVWLTPEQALHAIEIESLRKIVRRFAKAFAEGT